MVNASCSVDSDKRLAARPVGAQSTIRFLFPCRNPSTKALIIVVLPVPGPPVIIENR